MRRTWSTILALILSLLLVLNAAAEIVGGESEEMIWSFDDDQQILIADGELAAAPWAEYADRVAMAIFGDAVEEIPEGFLADCANLEQVMLPASVKRIGAGAIPGSAAGRG